MSTGRLQAPGCGQATGLIDEQRSPRSGWPFDVLIDPSKGIDDTTLTVATEPDRNYCFEVFGADGAESGRECVSVSR